MRIRGNRIAEKDVWLSGNEVHLRLCGGKGGLGRAVRQEEERRSGKLPRKRIQSLRVQIEHMERNREQVKSMNGQSNVEREPEMIDQKHQDIGERLQKAVAEGIKRTLNECR
jgi:hypothetical protein